MSERVNEIVMTHVGIADPTQKPSLLSGFVKKSGYAR